ncbi:DUF2789 family protein [Shewanella sp. NIFS-20-20]|uniref:DUF2789 family protein n=1 Tax=Shewanella sp. NIFS-20-20 TaxID=2853806 RepID=UPI001C43A1FB|nr:DUF2789 family protein [Shewanella sp. NIFS-20-20]MBV7317328.1 DUF2789 domain-containing protein [Shewanella sp. NIFS-20-20]
MDTTIANLSHLFEQLGLAPAAQDIEQFIATHSLDIKESICDASFWTPSQQAFLQEAISADSHWSELVDQLATRLQK